jgi:hypothetical protein
VKAYEGSMNSTTSASDGLALVIRNVFHILAAGSSAQFMALVSFNLFLSLENLIGWIQARRGWRANDGYGRGGISSCAIGLLKQLASAIEQDRESLQSSDHDLATIEEYLARTDLGPSNDEVYTKLCRAQGDLQAALTEFRESILARFKIEDLL